MSDQLAARMFNAVAPALTAGWWLPLSQRKAVADALLAVVQPELDRLRTTHWAFPRVQGRCPACKRELLFLGEGGYLTCAGHDCPDPCAAADALAEAVRRPAQPTDETEAQLHARRACPGWEYRTTEGPRKQWDGVDTPPCDDNGDPDPTWERNTDAGRDGWERFDYTEESYWRRRVAAPATQTGATDA